MNYLKIYYKLINKVIDLERNEYLELHHIVPKSIFGEGLLKEDNIEDVNQDSNLVYLNAREHFIAHWLLHRAFPKNKKLGFAFWAMAGMKSSSQNRDYKVSSRAFAEARVAASNAKKIPILQYDLNGHFLLEFVSINAASKKIGIVPNAIGSNLNSFTKSAGGFQWRFKTKINKNKIDPYVIENNGLRIGQYDLSGKLIKSFESLVEVEREIGHSAGTIRAAMNRGAKIKHTSYFFIQFNKYQEIPKELEPFVIPLHGFSIPIVQISADGKYFINEFPSVTHAAKFLNKNTGHISSACLHNRETAYGYIWKYRSEYVQDLPSININDADKKLHSKPIAQYDLNGKFIRHFKSSSEAARIMNDSQSNISAVAIGKRKYSNDYQYAYLEKGSYPAMLPLKKANNISREVLMLDKTTRDVIKEYKSVGLAAKTIGGSQSNISACINGRKKTAYGYKWIFK
jgi:hypothetical protein